MIYSLTLGLSSDRESNPSSYRPLYIETTSDHISEITEEEIKVVAEAFQGQIKSLIEKTVKVR